MKGGKAGRRGWIGVTTTLLLLSPTPSRLAAQDGPPPEERAAIDALVAMLQTTGTESLERYSAEHMHPEYRASLGGEGAIAHLASVREAADGALGSIEVELTPEGLLLRLSDVRRAELRVVFDADYRLTELAVVSSGEQEQGIAARVAVEGHLRAIEELGMASGDRFVSRHVDAELPARMGAEAFEALVARVGRAAGSAGSVMVDRVGEGYVVRFRSGAEDLDVFFSVAEEPPHLIDDLVVEVPDGQGSPESETLTWEGLSERLDRAAEEGFSGTVVAVRGGETVLRDSWGDARLDGSIPNGAATIFDIGSLPIDFTTAAVLLLAQQGALDLDDPITRFFSDVPDDRAGMTIRHLLNHESGLPNFHHRAEDEDRDLTWIDRETAERRILEAPLLFEPGTERALSHSAFTLLAAVVERVSRQPYVEMLRSHFFEPLGMESTGPYGSDLGRQLTAFAEGDGEAPYGRPNVPPRWGETSWLVMGGGGMVSTPDDYLKWFTGLRDGRILAGDALRAYLDRGSALGGTDRGFFFGHAWSGEDSMIVLAANAGTERPGFEALIRGLIALVERTGRLAGDG